MKNYYEILEVSNKASKEIIENAYNVLAEKYKIDCYTDGRKEEAEEKLKEINIAYKILSDDLLRDQYDNELAKEKEGLAKTIRVDYKEIETTKKPSKKLKSEEQEAYNGIVGLTQQIFRAFANAVKNIKSIDMVALGLTILIMVTLGVLLWVIPFTRDFIYNNFIVTFK